VTGDGARMSEPGFAGEIGATYRESTPWWPPPPRALGWPNVVLVVLDDTGFAHLGCYGSEIPTPSIDRLARGGLLYTGFHTTALCSPSRACLLTGRNHHSVGMRAISNWNSGYPNMRGALSPAAATVAQVLREDGYATFMVGKWHLAPLEEGSAAGPFRHWPLAKGFDRFYGFLNGETDQFYPELVEDNHPIDPPRTPEEGYHLSADLVDRAIELIADSKAMLPDRPFFTYLAFGAQHAPHHAPGEYLAKWRGRFDEGYDVVRERVFQRQLEMGVIPAGTVLAPRNPGVPPWDDLTASQRAFSCRTQEAFAAMLDHADVQIGRLVDFLARTGELDNTLLIVCSDNGASQEGGPYGVMNEFAYFNGLDDDVDQIVATRLDEVGTPKGYSNYPWGWAQVGNTPLKWYKQNTYGGGVRDPLIIHWPRGIAARGQRRHPFVHAVDVAATILDVAGATMPGVFAGVEQIPLHGVSIAPTFDDPSWRVPRVQYFEQLGHRGIYRDGWKLTTYHEAGKPWEDDVWGLYHLDEDFSECRDLSSEHPERRQEMLDLWWAEAERYGVLPLDDRGVELFLAPARPGTVHARRTYTYHPPVARIPSETAPAFGGRNWDAEADVVIDEVPSGVLFARGGGDLGIGWFVLDGELHLYYNALGRVGRVSGPLDVGPGRHRLWLRFARDGQSGRVVMGVDEREVAAGTIPQFARILGSAGMDIGHDSHAPVTTDYPQPFAFNGAIERLSFTVHARATTRDAAATLASEMAKE
jgi:arylsulfatase A-like enzyme